MEKEPKKIFKSDFLNQLVGKLQDGTFKEVLDDWRWIFTYSARYKGAIFFYVVLGILVLPWDWLVLSQVNTSLIL